MGLTPHEEADTCNVIFNGIADACTTHVCTTCNKAELGHHTQVYRRLLDDKSCQEHDLLHAA